MSVRRKTSVRIGLLIFVAILFSTAISDDPAYAAKRKKVKTIKFNNATNYIKVIKKGKKVKLKVSVTPKKASKKMTYRSSKPKTVKVSKKGTMRGLKKGTAYVTAYAKDGSGKKKKIKVIVGKPISKITLSGKNTVLKGNSTKLKAVISPKKASYKKLKWKSSNKKIATVNSSGKVTYKKDGVVTITAYAQDGSKVKKSFKITMASVKKNAAFFIAHRGYSSLAPENSIPAFILAAQNNFDGIECDIWEVDKETEEDEPEEKDFVVFHDASLNRMTSLSGNTMDRTFEELTGARLISGNGLSTYKNETISSFEEYLDIFDRYPKTRPIIEIKSYSDNDSRNLISDEGVLKLLSMIKDRGLLDRAMIISFGKTPLLMLKEAEPNIRTMLLSDKIGSNLSSDISWSDRNYMDGLMLKYTSVNNSVVNNVHKLNMQIGVYTLSSELQAHTYANLMDVDYITSNYKLWR